MKIFLQRILVIYLSSWLIAATPSYADDAVSIKEGDPAPFNGTLLTNQAAAELLVAVRSCDEKIDIEVQKERELKDAKCDLGKELLQITVDSQRQRFDTIIQSQDAQLDYVLKASTKQKISREAVFIIGVLSGVAITAVSAYSISAAAQIQK